MTTLNLGMVNVYLLKGEKGYILVDTGLKNSHKKIIKALGKLGIKPSEIVLIILTHGHDDHTGSVKALVDLSGAKVLMHNVEYQLMLSGDDGIVGITRFGKAMMSITRSMSKNQDEKDKDVKLPFTPDILQDEETYDLKDFGINGKKTVHTPGHTMGSLSVLLDDGNVMVGDSMMAMMPWSKPGKPFVGCDMSLTKLSMEKLLSMGCKTFHLSHGRKYDCSIIEIELEKFDQ